MAIPIAGEVNLWPDRPQEMCFDHYDWGKDFSLAEENLIHEIVRQESAKVGHAVDRGIGRARYLLAP